MFPSFILVQFINIFGKSASMVLSPSWMYFNISWSQLVINGFAIFKEDMEFDLRAQSERGFSSGVSE